jgi:hypothetical protein
MRGGQETTVESAIRKYHEPAASALQGKVNQNQGQGEASALSMAVGLMRREERHTFPCRCLIYEVELVRKPGRGALHASLRIHGHQTSLTKCGMSLSIRRRTAASKTVGTRTSISSVLMLQARLVALATPVALGWTAVPTAVLRPLIVAPRRRWRTWRRCVLGRRRTRWRRWAKRMHPDRSRRGFLGVHIVPQILSSYCVALAKVEPEPTTPCSCRSRGRDCVSVGDNVTIVHYRTYFASYWVIQPGGSGRVSGFDDGYGCDIAQDKKVSGQLRLKYREPRRPG